MSDDAKLTAIRWRRILFGFHLLVWLVARLAVGSIRQMPPAEIYDGLAIWGVLVFVHGLVLAGLDGRDHAELPFRGLRPLLDRERRIPLLLIDALLWVIFTTAIASRIIPEPIIFRYAAPLSLLWLTHTGYALAHVLLVLYAEINDRADTKRKHGEKPKSVPLMLADDGELVDFDFAQQQPRDEIHRH
jgi:hypothetical protein